MTDSYLKYLRQLWLAVAWDNFKGFALGRACEAFWNSQKVQPPRHWRTGQPLVELVRSDP